jgi:hypothetical protein
VSVSAYIDESYDLVTGFYILCATLVDNAAAERVRALARGLSVGSGKIHWHSEGADRRRLLTVAVAAMDVTHVAVIGRATQMREERARRKCLEALLPALERRGVSSALLESRQRGKNKGLISRRLQVLFSPGLAEPLLWLPDIVSGTMHLAERGQHDHTGLLAKKLWRLEIDAS